MQRLIKTSVILFLIAIVIVACTSSKIVNLQKIESKIFESIPEKQLPKDNLPAKRIEIMLADRTLVANTLSVANKELS